MEEEPLRAANNIKGPAPPERRHAGPAGSRLREVPTCSQKQPALGSHTEPRSRSERRRRGAGDFLLQTLLSKFPAVNMSDLHKLSQFFRRFLKALMCHSSWETTEAGLGCHGPSCAAPEQSPPTSGGGNRAQGGRPGGSPGGHLVPRPNSPSVRPAAQQELKRRRWRVLILHFYLQP